MIKKVPIGERQPLLRLAQTNQVWSPAAASAESPTRDVKTK
jgi:hypothetical protein